MLNGPFFAQSPGHTMPDSYGHFYPHPASFREREIAEAHTRRRVLDMAMDYERLKHDEEERLLQYQYQKQKQKERSLRMMARKQAEEEMERQRYHQNRMAALEDQARRFQIAKRNEEIAAARKVKEELEYNRMRRGVIRNILENEPQYCIVQGPNGMLYKMKSSDFNENFMSDDGSTVDDQNVMFKSSHGHNTFVPKETSEQKQAPIFMKDKRMSSSDFDSDEVVKAPKDFNKKQSSKMAPKSSRRQKSAIRSEVLYGKVEDASDDEMDDPLSVWTNRRPSEGQWMEPVLAFDNM